jgi:lipid II:glycine glycyltransferase (peptidoglycan interpeptide bridge formation enzyme)
MYTTHSRPEPDIWDDFVACHPRACFLQMSAWATLKGRFGWTSRCVALSKGDGSLLAGAQILYRRLPYRMGKLAYIPFGPLVDWSDNQQVQALFKLIDRVNRQEGAAFLKLEPGYDVGEASLRALNCRESPQTIQPPRTVVLDIAGPDDAILKRMNQGTRRNIRKSDKFDVQIRQGTRADVDSFNALLQATSERQEFGVHTSAYYENVYDLLIDAESPLQATLLIASYLDEETGQQKDLAGVFIFALGENSWYVYGASSREERQRMAPFGIQWSAIQWAKEQGAATYDMYGVPDEDPEKLEAEFTERDDGLWGVYRFKRGWGGRVVRTVGTWDRVYNPLIYWAYRAYLYILGGDE